MKKYSFVITRFFDYLVCRRFGLVDKVRIEDIELSQTPVSVTKERDVDFTDLVSLHDFRRRIVRTAPCVRKCSKNKIECSYS